MFPKSCHESGRNNNFSKFAKSQEIKKTEYMNNEFDDLPL